MPEPHTEVSTPTPSGVQQETLLQFAVAQSSAIFYIADLSGESPVRFISSNVETITGHKPEDFLREARYGHHQIHPDDLVDYKRRMGELAQERAIVLEYRFATKSGTYRWFRDELRLIDGDEEAREFVGCMIDITAEFEAKRKSQAAEKSRQRLQDAVESLPIGFIIYDREDRVVFANGGIAITAEDAERLADLAGMTREEVNRRILPQVRLFDGRPVSQTRIESRRLAGRSKRLSNQSLEIQLVDERWRLVSGYPTKEGGQVLISTDITEQKQRETELQLARETLEDAIESLSDGFVLYDADDRLVTCNAQYRQFHEDSKDLLVPGASWQEVTRLRGERGFFAEAEGNFDEWYAGQMAQRGVAKNLEFRAPDDKWFAYSHRPTRQGGFVSTWRDVTQRRQMEHELRESEILIRSVLEACPLPVRMWSPGTGQVIYESPASCAVFGRDATQLSPNERLSTYVDPDDRERYLARLREFGAVDNLEMRLRRADQTEFWATVSARLIDYKGEEVVVSSVVDLTERIAVEQSLRESGEMVRQVLEACPVAITMNRVDDGVIIYESPAARDLLDAGPLEPGESVVSRWVDPDDREAYLKDLRRTGAVDSREIRYKKFGDVEFPCALSSRLIQYRGEDVIVSNIVDLTERRTAEDELERQRELLHQSEKLSALGELLAGVSHELNNPLSVLVGQALMLQETAPDTKTANRAEKIGKAADRCSRIVKSFLAMARQEPRELVPVDLGAIIETTLDVTAYALRTSGIDVSVRMGRDLPTVMGDPDQLGQVLTNLIVNAQHALQDIEGPRKLLLSTSYRKKSDQVVIKVKDNGPGVPSEISSRIFEPLFTTKEIGVGTGIGLALCHRVVATHGGSIVLESRPGEGAAFAIRLPRAGRKEAGGASLRKRAPLEGVFRILVIDDEPDVGQIIADILEHDGHSVEVTESGLGALEKIKRQSYDAILSDIRMPGMDGPRFYRELSETRPEQIAGLAFITGDTLSPSVREFIDALERPYLEKPITPRDLRELVNLLLRRKVH